MGKKKDKKPEWTPENGGEAFAGRIIDGIENANPSKKQKKKSSKLEIRDYVDGVLQGDRTKLSRAITLLESSSQEHIDKAQQALKSILPRSGKSIRIGVTGSPGVGKSAFIDSLGAKLCERGHKVAVLAIDPTSSKSKGAILGDKTRMEKLTRTDRAFIRPSPSGGALGGVARKTRETIWVCEAAGYDIILIETVGVGQSEITVRSMTDMFLLLLLPGAGDDLQGLKKGTVELADMLIVNKADGDQIQKAELTKKFYEEALHYIMPATEGWKTKVFLASAFENKGIDNIWKAIEKFAEVTKKSGYFEKRRKEQLIKWVYDAAEQQILNRFYRSEKIQNLKPELEKEVLDGTITPTQAIQKLLEKF